MTIIFAGCMTAQKATQVVLTNTDAFNTVGQKWLSLNPCINDTQTIIHSDTAIQIDTAHIVDTAAMLGGSPYASDVLTITKTITVRDTAIQTIVDMAAINRLTDSLAGYRAEIRQDAANEVQLQASSDSWEGRYHGLLWWEVGIGLFLAIVTIVCKYFKLF